MASTTDDANDGTTDDRLYGIPHLSELTRWRLKRGKLNAWELFKRVIATIVDDRPRNVRYTTRRADGGDTYIVQVRTPPTNQVRAIREVLVGRFGLTADRDGDQLIMPSAPFRAAVAAYSQEGDA